MAYCKNCGAYIPDGQVSCLACGFDPAAEKKPETSKPKTEGAAAYQTSDSNEEMRRRLEEQRRRAREQNLQWADQEKRRREEQAAREAARKEQQEKARREAEAEYARRKAEQAAQQAAQQTAQQTSQGSAHYGASAGQGNKALAAISYLSILFAVPFFFAPDDRFARFHARQGMKLFIFGILADILAAMIGVGWIATLARLYLMYKGITNALNGRMEPLPYIGTIGDK